MVGERVEERIRHLYALCGDGVRVNERNLRKLLWDNRDTAYGKAFGFAGLQTSEAYRARAPLTEYEDYVPYLQAGGAAAVTAYPPLYTLLSSGTSGAQKRFPLTGEALGRYAAYLYDMPYYLSGTDPAGPHLHTSVFRSPVGAEGETLLSSAYYRYMEGAGLFQAAQYLGGRALLFADGMTEIPYFKLRLALACPELKSFQSIFLYDMVMVFSYLEANWETLLSDMAANVCSVPLPPQAQAFLAAQPAPEKAWLQALERELIQGFADPIVPRIWRSLRFVSGIGGEVYRRQTNALQAYIGDVPLGYFAYASSECMSGVAARFNAAEYLLLPESAFYEFLPPGEETRTLLPHELTVGERYEPVVSTFSGLYRYKTGDIVEIRGYHGASPLFTVCGRRNRVLDIAGEKLGEADAGAALEALIQGAECRIGDYSIGTELDVLPGRYVLYVECPEPRFAPEALAGELDRQLCLHSEDYRDVRQLGLVGPPLVRRVPAGLLARCAGETAAAQSQRKPMLFLNETQKAYLKAAGSPLAGQR